MAKKRRDKERPQPTKRQLSRWERQRKTQRITMAAGVLVIAGVMSMVGVAWFFNSYRPMHETVLSVNDTRKDMGYFLQVLRLYTQNSQFPSLTPQLADDAVRLIGQNEQIRQAAARAGVTVSNKEVDESLKKQGAPVNDVYRDLFRTQLLQDKLKDEYLVKDIPASQPQRQVQAMFLESQRQADEVAARLAGGEDFGALAEELSLDNATKTLKGDLGWVPKGIIDQQLASTVAEETVFGLAPGTVSAPVRDDAKTKLSGYLLVKLLEKTETQVHPQVMLLGSLEEAQNVRAQLVAGADFTELAKQFSQHANAATDGGDIGLIDKGSIPAPYADFANSAEVGAVSEPLKDASSITKGGFWLFKVTAEEASRELSEEHMAALKDNAWQDWLANVRDDQDFVVNNFLDDAKKDWAVRQVNADPRASGG